MSDQDTAKERMVTFSVIEEAAIIERIEEIARREDLSRSQVIRRAIRLFLSMSPVNGTIPQAEEVAS